MVNCFGDEKGAQGLSYDSLGEDYARKTYNAEENSLLCIRSSKLPRQELTSDQCLLPVIA
jgi:hypothetical protein